MLKLRTQILRDAGVIDADVADFTNAVIDLMAADCPGIPVDRTEAFTTHLAMSVQRIKHGEDVAEALDPAAWQEVQELPVFAAAVRFRDKMLALCPVAFPDSEAQYILVHICNMLGAG